MSQCEAAESSSQVNPQVIDGKERSPLDEVLRTPPDLAHPQHLTISLLVLVSPHTRG